MTGPLIECDVAVLGGGIAGMAVATALARQGRAVVCIDPDPEFDGRVGESLDWSSPALLADLGIERAGLLERGVATRKHHIHVIPTSPTAEEPFELTPRPWFALRPWRFELFTLHLDRARFDRELFEAARRAGVVFQRERVSSVHTQDGRVTGIATSSAEVRAQRYVDASGRARLLARAFDVPATTYGPPKVSIWTYLPTRTPPAGTTLHVGCAGDYLTWVWEIPVRDDQLSVGLTLPAEDLKARIAGAGALERVFREALEPLGRFRDALAERSELDLRTCSFQCLVHHQTSGPNWLLVGEAAAMVDPLTSHGFTAALRFGAHASALLQGSFGRESIPQEGRRVYDACLQRSAHAFNRHIERAAYDPALRRTLGTYRATLAYVLFGYFFNALYQKLQPRTYWPGQALRGILGGFEVWFVGWELAARCRARLARS